MQRHGGEQEVQQRILDGRYAACLGGSRNALFEALSGVHECVPLVQSSQDLNNALNFRAPKLTEELVKEGIQPEDQQKVFESRLMQEYASHKAMVEVYVKALGDMLGDFFEAAREKLSPST